MTAILDVAVGLGFVYLLFSLIISTVNELVARWSGRRGTIMWQSMAGIFRSCRFRNAVYRHPLVKSLGGDLRRPSYIPATVVALTVIDLVVDLHPASREHPGATSLRKTFSADPEADTDPQETLELGTRALLHSLIGNTGGSFVGAQLALEEWFTEAIKRTTGVYKRRTYSVTLGLALGTTLLFNIETLRIVNRLYYDSSLRVATASQGKDFLDESAARRDVEFPASIRQLRIPLGWSGVQDESWRWRDYLWDRPVSRACGFLLSALALSLGAPFWFDTLNKFVNLRQAGDRPADRTLADVINARST